MPKTKNINDLDKLLTGVEPGILLNYSLKKLANSTLDKKLDKVLSLNIPQLIHATGAYSVNTNIIITKI